MQKRALLVSRKDMIKDDWRGFNVNWVINLGLMVWLFVEWRPEFYWGWEFVNVWERDDD